MTMDNAAGPSHTQESENTAAASEPPPRCQEPPPLNTQRVFKKSSLNNKLTLYLSSRDLVVSAGKIDKLSGVLLVDPEFVQGRRIFGQITLSFRYGREDEEVMGLKFCNEAVMCLAQLYPPQLPPGGATQTTPLQDALIRRLGPNSYPFTMEITPLAPPSVQLVPAKEYNGAPIGTSYDVRAYLDEGCDEGHQKRAMIRMGIRVVQRAFAPPSPKHYAPGAGRTTKEQAKQNRKALLYGCRSAPLELKFANDPASKSRSVETVSSEDHHETPEKCVKVQLKPRPHDASSLDRRKEEEGSEDDGNSPGRKGGRVAFENDRTTVNGSVGLEEGVPEGHSLQDADSPDAENVDEDEAKISGYFHSTCGGKRPSLAAYLAGVPSPRAVVEKPFLLSDGKVFLTASLNKAIYSHGEDIRIKVQVRNNSSKTIKRIKVFVVQHVDVCMFSNGKFKNVVAMHTDKESCPIPPNGTLDKTYILLPINSITKNWIALEDSYSKSNTYLASTVCSIASKPEERNVFAIYVSYYVKVKLMVSVMGGEVSLKLPFTLMHTCDESEQNSTLTRVQRVESRSAQRIARDDIKPEKDGT
ncbi:phosrestin-2-like isoform X2 [Cylas formicarius]|uniref:phosrestin-2-like isoform X2 n=1 Tax=Cylas formicarius TaxID=197179 RepID=UPI0029586370|nr:phosrestin-2-like isoform X2 [Cylas formicarius]